MEVYDAARQYYVIPTMPFMFNVKTGRT